MKDLKIKVNSESESKEAQELFFKLGYYWNIGLEVRNLGAKFLYVSNNQIKMGYCSDNFSNTNYREITLAELRDMVVLKRNDVNDATHENSMYKYLKACDDWYYFDLGCTNKWQKSAGARPEYYEKLKPIEKTMKEYLDKDYVLREVKQTSGDNRAPSDWIEIPEGCNIITRECRKGGVVYFHWKSLDSDNFFLKDEKRWDNNFNETLSDFIKKNEGDVEIIWQRHTQPEELPFVDSINDKYAEIEQVRQKTIEATLAERQAQYGSFVGVANTTGALMAVIKNSKNGSTLPYAHEEALHMICSKMARIVNGDYNHKDSWHDIGGYSKLIEDLL